MPEDTTPHGEEAMHRPPDRAKIPQPRPASDEPGRPSSQRGLPPEPPSHESDGAAQPDTPSARRDG